MAALCFAPTLLALVLITAVLAAATVLPCSGSAHVVAMRWIAPEHANLVPLAASGALAGSAIAPLLVGSPRLTRRAREAVSWSREVIALTLAAVVGAVGYSSLELLAREMGGTAVGAGLGLLATSVALGSLAIAPAPSRRTLAGAPAGALGVALAFGALPGGSPLALGLAALVWSGLPEIDALEIAALATAPLHAIGAVRALRGEALGAMGASTSLAMGVGALGFLVALVALVLARRAARASKLAAFATWTATLGFALLAYAYVAAPG